MSGPKYRVDHDISMLVPEVWCRMRVPERDPRFLIDNGFLEKVTDFEWNGRTVLASRLGYRITALFAERFLGRIFETPGRGVSRGDPAAGEAGHGRVRRRRGCHRRRAATRRRRTISRMAASTPPVRRCRRCCTSWRTATGEGKGMDDPAVRAMFTREAVLESEWYQERLRAKQERDIALWKRHLAALETHLAGPGGQRFDVTVRLAQARAQLARVSSPAYLTELVGTIGADPATAASAG